MRNPGKWGILVCTVIATSLGTTAAAEEAGQPTPAVTESAARELVRVWGNAIGAGRESDYLSCYAPALRSGRRLPRAVVSVFEVSVTMATNGQATATFIERREHIDDPDRSTTRTGSRRLQLAMIDGRPRIVRQDNLTALSPSQTTAYRQILERAAERRARVTEAMSRVEMARIIGSVGNSGGAVADVLRGGELGGDMDRALRQTKGVGVAKAAPRQVRGKMKRGRVAIIGGKGTLAPDAVRRTVSRALGGIKACYERALRKNATLAGRVTVHFTVGGGGRVIAISAPTNTVAPAVGDCIQRRMKTLRFPPPEGGDVTFSNPFFFQPAN